MEKNILKYGNKEINLTDTQKAVLCKVINLPVSAGLDVIANALKFEREAEIYDYDAPYGNLVVLSFFHNDEYWYFNEKGYIDYMPE